MITAIPSIPVTVGTPRIIRGVRVEHVCGDPHLSLMDDFAVQQGIVRTALQSLETEVERPTVFEGDGIET